MLTEGFEPIHGYRLLNFLGRGQFGEVWRSTSPGGTHVALKFLNVREKQGRNEFRAIQKVKGIRYPHLAPTYALWLLDENMQVIEDAAFDSNQTLTKEILGGTLILQPAMELESQRASILVIATVLCERNLMERLRDCNHKGEKGISIPELIGYIEDAAKAIDFLNSPRHELGDGPVAIQHCDIKPENILILGDLAVVSDFGVSRILGSEGESRAKLMGGSVAYAAPETFDNRMASTSDQYSLAVTYYELRTGKLPFPKESQMQVIRDKLAGKLDFGEVSIPEANILQIATAVDPTDRFPTARAFVNALREAVGITTKTPRTQLRYAPIVLAAVASLVAILAGVWYLNLGPFSTRVQPLGTLNEPTLNELIQIEVTQNEGTLETLQRDTGPVVATVQQDVLAVRSEESTVVVGGDETVSKSKATEPNVVPKSLAPIKPFLVSIDGSGTHDSISKAIADSSIGETIKVLAGTYREHIAIDRSIKLVGVGGGVARVVPSENTCIKILGGSQVFIENITLDCQSSNSNGIEIVAGRLVLTQCNAFASSLNSDQCVKVRANATFVAEKCRFQTTLQTAVFGEPNSVIAIRDTDFSFSGNAGSGSKRIGIQGFGAKGHIQRCNFNGPCLCGIEWKDTPQELRIESCRFDNCDIAIQTKACNAVSINGTTDKPCEIKNAVWGLIIQRSRLGMSIVNVEGGSARNKVAMQITQESDVKCTDCNFVGCMSGIAINQSSITLDNVSIRESSLAGILVDSGIVHGSRVNLLDSARYGLIVLNKDASVLLNSLEVKGSKNQEFTVPVYVASGKVEFKTGVFSDCLCGIIVDPTRALLDGADLAEKRNLNELIGSSANAKITVTPIEVLSDRMTLNHCMLGWYFNGVGSSRIKLIDGDIPKSNRAPKLAEDLELDGTDLTNFAVIPKKRRK